MKKIKNILLAIVMGVVAFMPFMQANAGEKVNIYLFYGDGCPYCEAAMEYISKLEKEHGDKFELVKYEVWNNAENAELMSAVAAKFNENINGVPYIVIGDKTFQGYASEYDADILAAINASYEKGAEAYDVMNNIESGSSNNTSSTAVYITLGVIVVSLVGLLAFSKAKAN